jgi:hypothetical protein
MAEKKLRCPRLDHLTREEIEKFYAQARRKLEVSQLEAHMNYVLVCAELERLDADLLQVLATNCEEE